MAFDFSSLTTLLKSGTNTRSPKAGVLGIDIGSSAIKIVQLKDVKGIPTLETYGELQLGPYEGVDLGRGTHLPPLKLIEALVDILREAGATGQDVVFALSYNSSFTTTITVPTLDQERISTMIPIEARKYIPISLSKVTLDWSPLSTHIEEKTTEVLLSAIYNEALTKYEAVMNGSELNILANEIEIFSTMRSVLAPKDTVVAILDCGASSTRLYIVRNGMVGKTHSVLLSGVELTQSLEKELGVEFKKAEQTKRTHGIVGDVEDPRIQKTLISSLERGLRELHTVITRYEEAEKIHVEKIILSGSGAMLKGLVPYIQDMFSRPTSLADPFAKVAYPAFLEDALKATGPSLAVATGVALRAFQNNKN